MSVTWSQYAFVEYFACLEIKCCGIGLVFMIGWMYEGIYGVHVNAEAHVSNHYMRIMQVQTGR